MNKQRGRIFVKIIKSIHDRRVQSGFSLINKNSLKAQHNIDNLISGTEKISIIISRNSEVYSCFYQLKFNRAAASKNKHYKLAALELDRVFSGLRLKLLKLYFSLMIPIELHNISFSSLRKINTSHDQNKFGGYSCKDEKRAYTIGNNLADQTVSDIGENISQLTLNVDSKDEKFIVRRRRKGLGSSQPDFRLDFEITPTFSPPRRDVLKNLDEEPPSILCSENNDMNSSQRKIKDYGSANNLKMKLDYSEDRDNRNIFDWRSTPNQSALVQNKNSNKGNRSFKRPSINKTDRSGFSNFKPEQYDSPMAQGSSKARRSKRKKPAGLLLGLGKEMEKGKEKQASYTSSLLKRYKKRRGKKSETEIQERTIEEEPDF